MALAPIKRRRWQLFCLIALAFVAWWLAAMFNAQQRLRSQPPLPTATTFLSDQVTAMPRKLWNLSLGSDGFVYGSRGPELLRIVPGGEEVESLHVFEQAISAIHQSTFGLLMVATDSDRWDNNRLCRIYRMDEGGGFKLIKTIERGVALPWSISSDSAGRIFVGEYGPQQQGSAKTVWRSDDGGDSWAVSYQALDQDKTHIHRVAVDPYTDDVWVTVGDGKNRAMLRSQDHGETWQQLRDDQSTGVAFTEDAIYWGRDEKGDAGITQYDRASGRFSNVLKLVKLGNFGGSIYSMTSSDDGTVYAATMKYAEQEHVASLWAGRNQQWQPLAFIDSEAGRGTGLETVAGPDKEGWIYITGFKIKTR